GFSRDWSSDVCSSDLLSPRVGVDQALDAVAAAVDLGCQVGGGGGSHIHAASSSVAMRGRRRLSRTSPRPASSLVLRASANCWWADRKSVVQGRWGGWC